MSAMAAEMPIPNEDGIFKKMARKAKAAAAKSKKGIGVAARSTWSFAKKIARKSVRIGEQAITRTVGFAGVLLFGALKLVVAVVNVVVVTVSLVISVAVAIVSLLIGFILLLVTVPVIGLMYVSNLGFDFSSWLVRGRPINWRLHREIKRTYRTLSDERRWYKLFGPMTRRFRKVETDDELDDRVAAYDDMNIDYNKDTVQLVVRDATHSLVEEQEFATEQLATEYVDEHYVDNSGVYIEITPITEAYRDVHIDRLAEHSANLSEEERIAAAAEVVRTILGEDLVNLLSAADDANLLRRLIDDDLAVPTEEEIAAGLSAVDEARGLPLMVDQVPSIADPENYDWTQHLLRPEVLHAYSFFRNLAQVNGDRKSASYWGARTWLRNRHVTGEKELYQNRQQAMALFVSQSDRSKVDLNAARKGIKDECDTIDGVTLRLLKALDEHDEQDAVEAKHDLGTN